MPTEKKHVFRLILEDEPNQIRATVDFEPELPYEMVEHLITQGEYREPIDNEVHLAGVGAIIQLLEDQDNYDKPILFEYLGEEYVPVELEDDDDDCDCGDDCETCEGEDED